MGKTDKILIEVTPDEEELIAAIRNYCKTYPDGYPELLLYAQRLFDIMVDMPKNDLLSTDKNLASWKY
ncbi:MAG: hypothetical protein IKB95_10120 [Bacteroidales bacterium]|nr:hypothetical protein [Bacteroidales bacterium]